MTKPAYRSTVCVSVNLLVRHSLHLFCVSMNLLVLTFTSFVLSISELISTYIHSICFVYQWAYYYVHSLHLFCLSENLLLRTFTPFVLCISELISTSIYSVDLIRRWLSLCLCVSVCLSVYPSVCIPVCLQGAAKKKRTTTKKRFLKNRSVNLHVIFTHCKERICTYLDNVWSYLG